MLLANFVNIIVTIYLQLILFTISYLNQLSMFLCIAEEKVLLKMDTEFATWHGLKKLKQYLF